MSSLQGEHGDGGVLVRTILDAGPGGLVRRLTEVPAGTRHDTVAGPGGQLWFVIMGSGQLEPAGRRLRPGVGLWLPPGTRYGLTAGVAGPLRLDCTELPAGGPAQPGAAPAWSDLRDAPTEVTGNRRFRVLFGPGRGCDAATQFVGEIPPGRAPDHSHPYDETVLVLDGQGVLHAGADSRPLAPGDCVHLPPGRQHCLENTGRGLLRVLGVFHPGGSPAVKTAQES